MRKFNKIKPNKINDYIMVPQKTCPIYFKIAGWCGVAGTITGASYGAFCSMEIIKEENLYLSEKKMTECLTTPLIIAGIGGIVGLGAGLIWPVYLGIGGYYIYSLKNNLNNHKIKAK